MKYRDNSSILVISCSDHPASWPAFLGFLFRPKKSTDAYLDADFFSSQPGDIILNLSDANNDAQNQF